MTIFQIPLENAMAWLLALAFVAAGLANALGGADVKTQFVRWGYPAWWNLVTAALEILGAALIVAPETRLWGLAFEGTVLIAAMATVAWRQEYKHLLPAAALSALIGGEWALIVAQ